MALEDQVLEQIDALDAAVVQCLSDYSLSLFGVQLSPEMIAKMKYYIPLAYRKPDSDRPPLVGARMLSSNPIVSRDGLGLVKGADSVHLSEIVAPGCKLVL